MKTISYLAFRVARFAVLLFVGAMMLTSCLDDDSKSYNDDALGNFEAAWNAMDEHYCFFKEKDVDWNKVYNAYKPYFRDSVKTVLQEFNLLGSMLAQVRDGHVNLYSEFNTARYWKWYEDYPTNFDENLLKDYYLGNNYWTISGLQYCALKDSIGYVRYPSFSSTPGSLNLDYALTAVSYCRGLIIDIRNNGGGSLTNVPKIANRFATEKTCYGYISHKTGKGHSDFSTPEAIYLEPETNRVNWDASVQPVVVLTNRHTFSAANNFVQAMRALAETKTMDENGQWHDKMIVTIGDRSGGGGGMPFETVLPNGWILRFSACPITDHRHQHTEEGIDPDIKIDMDSTSMIEQHKDDIIERAREYILANTRKEYKKEEE